MLQCGAVCWGWLWCVAVCCRMLQDKCLVKLVRDIENELCCDVVQCVARVAVCCGVLQCVAVCCSVSQCVAVCCSVWTAECHTCAARRVVEVQEPESNHVTYQKVMYTRESVISTRKCVMSYT